MATPQQRPALPVQPALSLQAATAGELMTANPTTVCRTAKVGEVTALMTDKGITIAPVVDESGRPVGVVSMSDILIHDREFRRTGTGDATADQTPVAEVMTPTVIAVHPETASSEVVRTLLANNVHNLFVADDRGALVGVISMGDIVRNLA